jgi:beta-glucosidase
MPGPSRWRNTALTHAVLSGKLDEKTLDDRVRNVLVAIREAGKSGVPENSRETSDDTPAQRRLLRQAAADSIVLLKNSGGVLPLHKSRSVRIWRDTVYGFRR